MNEWHDLFAATAAAAAALTGLIFVGVSINLTRILSFPNLPGRALNSLVILVAILLISIISLIPYQSLFTISIEVLIIGFITWFIVLFTNISIFKNLDKQYKNAGFLIYSQIKQLLYHI